MRLKMRNAGVNLAFFGANAIFCRFALSHRQMFPTASLSTARVPALDPTPTADEDNLLKRVNRASNN